MKPRTSTFERFERVEQRCETTVHCDDFEVHNTHATSVSGHRLDLDTARDVGAFLSSVVRAV